MGRKKYAVGQHDMICELLDVWDGPDDPGDTAYEAVLRLQDRLDEAESLLRVVLTNIESRTGFMYPVRLSPDWRKRAMEVTGGNPK